MASTQKQPHSVVAATQKQQDSMTFSPFSPSGISLEHAKTAAATPQPPSCSLCHWIKHHLLFGRFTPYMRAAELSGGTAVRPEALPPLEERDRLEYWSERFANAAEKQWKKRHGRFSRHPFLSALIAVFGWQIASIFLLRFIQFGINIACSRFIGYFLQWQESSQNKSAWDTAYRLRGIMCGIALLGVQLLRILVMPQFDFWINRVGLRIDGALGTCLLRRTLMGQQHTQALMATAPLTHGARRSRKQLAQINREEASTYNLLTLDIPSISRTVCTVVDMVFLPFSLCWTFYELRSRVGSAARPGLIILCSVSICVILLEVYNAFLKRPLMRRRDIRLHYLSDTMTNIRNIRMTGWEHHAQKQIKSARASEIRIRAQRMFVHGFSWAMADNNRPLTQLTIFSYFVLQELRGREGIFALKASIVIPVIQLVLAVVSPLSSCSFMSHSLLEGWVSILRYEKHVFGTFVRPKDGSNSFPDQVLAARAREDPALDEHVPFLSEAGNCPAAQLESCNDTHLASVSAQNAVFSWPYRASGNNEYARALEESPFRLQIPNLLINRGDCFVLLGCPGSGKSSFISALLGEMQCLSGTYHVARVPVDNTTSVSSPLGGGTAVGYSSQLPWLPEGSIRSAIVMGRRFEPHRYQRVIKACNLLQDLESWVDGDSRIIFQGGQNLSGGQRARVCLARALYSYPMSCENEGGDAFGCYETFFLDDPFSSMDPSVAYQVFRELVGQSGLLRHAASVMTMDQQNLTFFLRSLRLSGEAPAVKFYIKMITDGVLVDFPLESLDETIPEKQDTQPSSPETETIDTTLSPLETSHALAPAPKTDVGSFLKNERTSEQTYSGVVGSSTHKWYLRHINFCLLVLIVLLLLTVNISQMSTELWLAQWTDATRDEPTTASTSPPTTAANTTLTAPSFIQFSDSSNSRYSSIHNLPQTSAIRDPAHTLMDNYHLNELVPFDIKNSFQQFPTVGSDAIYHIYSSFLQLEGPTASSKTNTSDSQPGNPPKLPVDVDPYVKVLTYLQPVWRPFSKAWNYVTTCFPPKEEATRDSALKPLVVFCALSICVVVARFINLFCQTYGCLQAAIKIHDELLNAIITAPFWLFDITPLGVIINRFSSDIQAADTSPLFQLARFVNAILQLLLITVALGVLTPWCVPLIFILGYFIYSLVYKTFRPASREFQRSKLLALSPLCSNLTEAETGAVVIRAFGAEHYYIEENVRLTSNLLKAQFIQYGAQQWASARFQLFSFPFTAMNSVVPLLISLVFETIPMGSKGSFVQKLLQRFHVNWLAQSTAFIGMATTYAIHLPDTIKEIAFSITLLETVMCSIQRLKGLTTLTTKSPDGQLVSLSNTKEEKHRKNRSGELIGHVQKLPSARTGIRITDLEVAYQRIQASSNDLISADSIHQSAFTREFLPPALRIPLGFINTGEHIGIVGRTGAGKSTFLLSLTNLIPLAHGSILIDGVPISRLSPSILRKVIGVLPQVPLVMKGWTVREFLDPDDQFCDSALHHAVAQVKMSATIAALPQSLDTVLMPDELENPTKAGKLKNSKKNRTSSYADDDLEASSLMEDSTISVFSQKSRSAGVRWLTESQLRILSIARLALNADHYRLVLVDEPPARQVQKQQAHNLSAPKNNQYPTSATSLPATESLGSDTFSDYVLSGSDSSSSRPDSTSDQLGSTDVELGHLLRQLFPRTTVIIAAHYASTICHCESVWIFSRGHLARKIPGHALQSQEDLMRVIADAEAIPLSQLQHHV